MNQYTRISQQYCLFQCHLFGCSSSNLYKSYPWLPKIPWIEQNVGNR